MYIVIDYLFIYFCMCNNGRKSKVKILLHLPVPAYMVVNSSTRKTFSGAHFDDANLLRF